MSSPPSVPYPRLCPASAYSPLVSPGSLADLFSLLLHTPLAPRPIPHLFFHLISVSPLPHCIPWFLSLCTMQPSSPRLLVPIHYPSPPPQQPRSVSCLPLNLKQMVSFSMLPRYQKEFTEDTGETGFLLSVLVPSRIPAQNSCYGGRLAPSPYPWAGARLSHSVNTVHVLSSHVQET